jgi:hypothetical protein
MSNLHTQISAIHSALCARLVLAPASIAAAVILYAPYAVEVRHQHADGNGSIPYDKRKFQRDEADCEIERHRRPCGITDNGQTKLAAAQPDKTGQAANRNAPSKRLLKIGTTDNGAHVLFVTKFGFRDHYVALSFFRYGSLSLRANQRLQTRRAGHRCC